MRLISTPFVSMESTERTVRVLALPSEPQNLRINRRLRIINIYNIVYILEKLQTRVRPKLLLGFYSLCRREQADCEPLTHTYTDRPSAERLARIQIHAYRRIDNSGDQTIPDYTNYTRVYRCINTGHLCHSPSVSHRSFRHILSLDCWLKLESCWTQF